jgi:hypothetical protein
VNLRNIHATLPIKSTIYGKHRIVIADSNSRMKMAGWDGRSSNTSIKQDQRKLRFWVVVSAGQIEA